MAKARWLAIVAVILIAAATLGRFALPPTLWVAREPGAIDPADYLFIVRNPFRDRAPERAGHVLLKQLATGNCVGALSFVDSSRREDVCGREREYPLLRWSVAQREDTGGKSRVHFLTTRRIKEGTVDRVNVWITFEQRAESWQPVEFECWY